MYIDMQLVHEITSSRGLGCIILQMKGRRAFYCKGRSLNPIAGMQCKVCIYLRQKQTEPDKVARVWQKEKGDE